MSVASGQMPYNYGVPLPFTAFNSSQQLQVGPSGDLIENGMFVLVAEIRKWSETGDDLGVMQYDLYTHPDVPPVSFDPKPSGDTLVGLVTGERGLIAVNNIEQMRDHLETLLFDAYAENSAYEPEDFMRSWLQTVVPESPSGTFRLINIAPNAYLNIKPTWLRPAATHISDGDYIDNGGVHWLGASGVLLDVDLKEVIFNPFPFFDSDKYLVASNGDHRFQFGPITPAVQTTLGSIPSVQASRYQDDPLGETFQETINFEALASGYVQMDGYCLVPETLIELVQGNDDNFGSTVSFSNDYTDHIEGLRQVNDRENDSSARCYRIPTTQPSGLYRLLAHNPKDLVSEAIIPSGFVSLWPQGIVIKADDGTLRLDNRIDGQQLDPKSDGTFALQPEEAVGLHVMDDAIWVTSVNEYAGSGSLDSRGLFVVSPYNGDFVWYRPAELTIASDGNAGSFLDGPGHWGVHIGLIENGGELVRLSRRVNRTLTVVDLDNDISELEIFWQRYNPTTLSYNGETSSSYTVETENETIPINTRIQSAFTDGSKLYMANGNNQVHRFTTGYQFDGYFTGFLAGRRYYVNGEFFYTITDAIQSFGVLKDPMTESSFNGQPASGIGRWSITSEPADILTEPGTYVHDSAKPLRAENHFGFQNANETMIHDFFYVDGATHVRNGYWLIIQFGVKIYLCRITERTNDWLVLESIELRDSFSTPGAVTIPDEFPLEGILRDID